MKILYSDLRKLIPGLRAKPKAIADFLTMAGFMLDGMARIKYQGKADILMSFEVRHNRGDCLSVLGLAYEVAAKYGLKAKPPIVKTLPAGKSKVIKVADGRYIKRILAYEISGLKNRQSPAWLREYLALNGINSKNLLVDLSNYVMLITGYPSHLLDLEKITGHLCWDMNKKYQEITTLDGTKINLTRDREIILRDDRKILALAGIVGGKNAELSLNTTAIIAEAAIYHPGTVRQNASNLKIATEAGTRLSKYLDPAGLDYAMRLLLGLIVRYCGAENTKIKEFGFYPQKIAAPKIKFDPAKPGFYAGIEIPRSECLQILKNLRFQVKSAGNQLTVTPPSDRLDVTIEEDVIEEVLRLFGFEKIPVAKVPPLEIVPNITPKTILLAEKARDIFAVLGYDEILSSPLVAKKANRKTNFLDWKIISTQNSVNEECPDLRQSITAGLINQSAAYRKKNLEFIKIFEIGKIFGEKSGKFLEHESVGVLNSASPGQKSSLNQLKRDLELALRQLGISEIKFAPTAKLPRIANPYAAFDIFTHNQLLGLLYQIRPEEMEKSAVAEINLDMLADLLGKIHLESTEELLGKLVKLDVNVFLDKKESVGETIGKAKTKIGKRHLWSVVVKDAFPQREKVKYTLGVTYAGLSDQKAKKLHAKVFNL
jgi:phenylalanyl-tRNA synthetase beta chain